MKWEIKPTAEYCGVKTSVNITLEYYNFLLRERAWLSPAMHFILHTYKWHAGQKKDICESCEKNFRSPANWQDN